MRDQLMNYSRSSAIHHTCYDCKVELLTKRHRKRVFISPYIQRAICNACMESRNTVKEIAK